MKQAVPELKHAASDTTLAAARLGHEINNLLQPLCANLQMLAAGWNALAPTLSEPPAGAATDIRAVIPEVLTEMRECLNRMAGIVRATKLPPTAFQLLSQPLINPYTVLNDARRAVHARAGKTAIVMDMPDDAPPAIRGDAAELTQVFVNLILNALAATRMAPAPHVTLACRAGPADRVEMEVRDNGSGIAPEIVDRLFQPFVSTCRDEGGTGLGLCICREIIQRHHGEIKTANGTQGGAIFTVSLPAGGL